MIDLHTHILPGLDDGVRSEDEAVEFARVALRDGIRTVVATPHCKEGFFFVTREEVLRETARLRDRLVQEQIGLRLLPGAEVHLCPDLPERIRDGRAPTLGDNGKTLLLELSTSQYPVRLEDLVFTLKLGGTIPLFAHPERIRYFQDDLRRWDEMVRLGAYGQVTAGSLLGLFGEDARDTAEAMVRRRTVHVLASDAHNVRNRRPEIAAARDRIARMLDEDAARFMVDGAPAALLRGESPEVPWTVEPEVRRTGLLSRLFGRRLA